MQYLEEFSLIRIARVGVVISRTKEVRRLTDLLVGYAAKGESSAKPVYVWSITKGWTLLDYSKKPAAWKGVEALDPDNPGEVLDIGTGVEPCLAMIPRFDADAICIMQHPHESLDSPRVKQILLDFSHDFRHGNGHTLVMICPDGTKIPNEIEADMVVLDLPLPNEKELALIVEDKLGDKRQMEGAEKRALVHACRGMTSVEAERAVARAAAVHIDEIANVESSALVHEVLTAKVSIIEKSETLALYPSVNLSEVGGLNGLKGWLEFNKVRLDPSNYPKGADKLQGMLMVGPPGTGKSLCAKATASVLGLPLIRLDLGACFGGIVGESEAKMEATMKTLKALGPSVCWIDEIEKAGLSAGANGDSGASSRMLGKLLFEMQEMNEGVFWVLTSNDVTSIPIELLRPGRLDEKWLVDLPNATDRLDILRIHLRKRFQKPLLEQFNDAFVDASHGFIGSEISKVVIDSITYCLNKGIELTGEVLVSYAKQINPTSKAFGKRFTEMAEWGRLNARNASEPFNAMDGAIMARNPRPSLSRPAIAPRPVIAKR